MHWLLPWRSTPQSWTWTSQVCGPCQPSPPDPQKVISSIHSLSTTSHVPPRMLHASAGNPCQAEAPHAMQRIGGALRRNRVARQGTPSPGFGAEPDLAQHPSPQLFFTPGSGARPARPPLLDNGLRRSVCIQVRLPSCSRALLGSCHRQHTPISVLRKLPCMHGTEPAMHAWNNGTEPVYAGARRGRRDGQC